VQKYALIVLGSLPVIILYPFIQRFFTKGIMIGSLKG
jgi:putative aldouronate transport system permease protein